MIDDETSVYGTRPLSYRDDNSAAILKYPRTHIPFASFMICKSLCGSVLRITSLPAIDWSEAGPLKRSRGCLLTSTSRRVINLYRSRRREYFANSILVTQLSRITSERQSNVDASGKY